MANESPLVIKNGEIQQLPSGDNILVKTEAANDNSTKAASTAYADNAVSSINPSTAGISYQLIPEQIVGSNTNSSLGANNQVQFFRFTVTRKITVVSIHFYVSGTNAGSLCAVGIYNSAGTTKLIDSGAISSASSGLKSVTLGASVTLTPGDYIMAWTLTSKSANLLVAPVLNPINILNGSVIVLGAAGNASAAGVLPTTLGTLTTALSSGQGVALVKLQA